jgi:tryptophanyl-tRNA synthetase
MSPGVQNLLMMLKAAGGAEMAAYFTEEVQKGTIQYGRMKEAVADQLIQLTDPFREKRKEIEAHSDRYKKEIMESSAMIREKAIDTVREVKELIGLMNIP